MALIANQIYQLLCCYTFFLFSTIDRIHGEHSNKDIARNEMDDHQVPINSFISLLYAYFFWQRYCVHPSVVLRMIDLRSKNECFLITVIIFFISLNSRIYYTRCNFCGERCLGSELDEHQV
jgi:hypothetical protein